MAVTLYRQVGKGKARRYKKVNLGPGRRPNTLAGPYFLRYSLTDGTRPWDPVGNDLDGAIDAQTQKQAYFDALSAGVSVAAEPHDANRVKIGEAIREWLVELRIFQGKDQQGKSEKNLRAYAYRLGFFLDFAPEENLKFVDQIGGNQLLAYVSFLREHPSNLQDRTVHNVFETLNTWLRSRNIFLGGRILGELDYAEKPPKPYSREELESLFAVMNGEERLPYGYSLIRAFGTLKCKIRNTKILTSRNARCTFSRSLGAISA